MYNLILILFFSFMSVAHASEMPINERTNRSIEQSQEIIDNTKDNEPAEVIHQQQQILQAIDELNYFKSIENARKILQEIKQLRNNNIEN